jgi:hypothetical protein
MLGSSVLLFQLCKQGASSFLSQSPQSKTEQLMQRIEEHESRMQLQPRGDASRDSDAQTARYLDLADSRKSDRSDASLAKRTNTKYDRVMGFIKCVRVALPSDALLMCANRSGDVLQKKARADQPSQAAILVAESEQEQQRKRMLESGDDFDFSDDGSRSTVQAPAAAAAAAQSNDLVSLTRRLSYTGSLPDSLTADKEVRLWATTGIESKELWSTALTLNRVHCSLHRSSTSCRRRGGSRV